jgi:Mrp family chromosome partitioning ATPase
MGRTFEALGSRLRKAAGGESVAIPFPVAEREVAEEPEFTGPQLVPMSDEDLPGDDNQVPYIEVGGPREKKTAAPNTKREPERTPALPASGVAFHLFVPEAQSSVLPSPDVIAYHHPEHPTARQYRLLSDGIAAQLPAAKSPVVLFTSASPHGATKATVANLAVTRAADGSGRVLVVELERTGDSIAERLGSASMPGLRELLARTVPLTVAVHRTGADGVFFVPPGKMRVNLEDAARLRELLDQLRTRFDWLIVDAPIWGTSALSEWAKASDGVYLVLGHDEWNSPLADAAAEGITRVGGQLRGCVTIQ